MRIVVFTENQAIRDTRWWALVQELPGVAALLLCRQERPRRPRDIARRIVRNIRKHGWMFVPYRIAVLVRDAVSPLGRKRHVPERVPDKLPCEEIVASTLRDPEVIAKVRAWRADLGLSLGAPILESGLFRAPVLGTLNLHLGSPPEFRGAPPAFWELWTGATRIGAVVHWMEETLDTGPIVARGEAPIFSRDTLRDVEMRVEELGVRVLRNALARVSNGEFTGMPQSPGGTTYRFPTLGQRLHLWWRCAQRRRRRGREAVRALVKRVGAVGLLYAYRPLRDAARTIRGSHPVRIFTFHRVSALCRDGMTVTPDTFRSQIAYVAGSHRMVSLADALSLIRRGVRLRRPVAAVTFDDGYRSVLEYAWPILRRRSVPGCCFVCSDYVGTDRVFAHDADSEVREYLDLLTWDELAEMRASGWIVGAHSATHARLSTCGEQLAYELREPIDQLRSRLGLTHVVLAYPFGGRADVPADFPAIVRGTGYEACFSNYGGDNPVGADPWSLRRIDLGGDHEGLAWRAAAHGIELSRFRDAYRNVVRRRRAGARDA